MSSGAPALLVRVICHALAKSGNFNPPVPWTGPGLRAREEVCRKYGGQKTRLKICFTVMIAQHGDKVRSPNNTSGRLIRYFRGRTGLPYG